MKTVEEKARVYAKKLIVLENRDKFSDEANLRAAEYYAYKAYSAGYSEAMRCIDQKEELPDEAGCDFCRDEQGYTIGNMYVCDKCGRQVP